MSQMALDISSRRTLPSVSSPSSMTSVSSPSSPNHASMDSQSAEIASSQYLKAISEGASRILSQQQHTLLYSSSPSSSLLDSPQQSPLQDQNSSHNSVSPQPQSHSHSTGLSIIGPTIAATTAHANHQQSSVRLKFSIDHILSPEFGKNGTECLKKVVNGEKSKSNHKNRIHHPLDVTSLTNKRKHSSDSESSTISSLSNASRDTINNSHYANKKETTNGRSETSSPKSLDTKPNIWPAWVYCTRYSDRPSSGPRSRKIKKKDKKPDEKRPRTAFTAEQLARLKQEFQENRYLNERRRQDLARDLKLNESQIKIWFQNKRAKIKKSSGNRNPLAMHLMAQGLYNHSTVSNDGECDDDDDDSDERDSSCVSPSDQSDHIKNKLS